MATRLSVEKIRELAPELPVTNGTIKLPAATRRRFKPAKLLTRQKVFSKQSSPAASYLALGEGIFYLVSGIWPLLNRKSFESVTGPKTDFWLVRTVGTLIAVIGAVLVLAGRRRRVTPEIALLGAGAAAGLAAIDVLYVERRRISRIYLLDALAEIALVGAWLAVILRLRKP